jgi:hypothetical protein
MFSQVDKEEQEKERHLPDWLGITAHLSASWSGDDSYILFTEDGEPCHEEERMCMMKGDSMQTTLSTLPEQNTATTFGRGLRQSQEEERLQESFETSPLAYAYKRTVDRDPSWMFNIVDDLFTDDLAKACEMAEEIIEADAITKPKTNSNDKDRSKTKRSSRRNSKDKLPSDSNRSSQSIKKKVSLSTNSDQSSTRSRSKQKSNRGDNLSSVSGHNSTRNSSKNKRDEDRLSSGHSSRHRDKDNLKNSDSEHSSTRSDKEQSKSGSDRKSRTTKSSSTGSERKKKSLWTDVRELVVLSPRRKKEKSRKSPLQKIQDRLSNSRDGEIKLPPTPALQPIRETFKAENGFNAKPGATKAGKKKISNKKSPNSKLGCNRSYSPVKETELATVEDASTDASTDVDQETKNSLEREKLSRPRTVADWDKLSGSVSRLSTAKCVVFASDAIGKDLMQIQEVESYRDMDLWYKRTDLKQMMCEAEVIGGLYGGKCKELIAALNAIYQSFQRPMSEADKSMVMRFLALNSAARGLEHHVVSRGSFLSKKYRSLIMQAKRLNAEKEKHSDVWDAVRSLSKEAEYMAIMLAEFDAGEIHRVTNPSVNTPVMVE